MRLRVLEKLQSETKQQSCVVEADALGFVDKCSFEHYRDYLVRCYGFEAPFESACALTPCLASHSATTRPRSRYIAQDLVALGFPPERLLELEPCPMQPFRDLNQALGWLYVAERNVMTNSRCHRHLAEHAPDLAARASYLNCYGTSTAARWRSFGITLERAAANGDPERIAAVANESFELLHRWLQAGHA
ncbi:MAG TPA: biliverdin-producing heme oxygenase [Kofleriaceae bacterium]